MSCTFYPQVIRCIFLAICEPGDETVEKQNIYSKTHTSVPFENGPLEPLASVFVRLRVEACQVG